MATLPPKEPHCQFCNSTDLILKEKIVGEHAFRRIERQVICRNCDEVCWVVS